jgi:hypothetical protein
MRNPNAVTAMAPNPPSTNDAGSGTTTFTPPFLKLKSVMLIGVPVPSVNSVLAPITIEIARKPESAAGSTSKVIRASPYVAPAWSVAKPFSEKSRSEATND